MGKCHLVNLNVEINFDVLALGRILQCFKMAVVSKSMLGKETSDSPNATVVCRRVCILLIF